MLPCKHVCRTHAHTYNFWSIEIGRNVPITHMQHAHTHVNSFYHLHVACMHVAHMHTRTMFGSTEMVSTSQQADTVDFLA